MLFGVTLTSARRRAAPAAAAGGHNVVGRDRGCAAFHFPDRSTVAAAAAAGPGAVAAGATTGPGRFRCAPLGWDSWTRETLAG